MSWYKRTNVTTLEQKWLPLVGPIRRPLAGPHMLRLFWDSSQSVQLLKERFISHTVFFVVHRLYLRCRPGWLKSFCTFNVIMVCCIVVIYYKNLLKICRPTSIINIYIHSTGNTSVKKEAGHSNTRGTVRLFSIPAEILLHIVYIFNILCGLEVIISRRLQ